VQSAWKETEDVAEIPRFIERRDHNADARAVLQGAVAVPAPRGGEAASLLGLASLLAHVAMGYEPDQQRPAETGHRPGEGARDGQGEGERGTARNEGR
jgi:hypothetical protein